MKVCLITDRHVLPPEPLGRLVARLAACGLDRVMLRDRGAGGEDLLRAARALQGHLGGTPAELLVNSRPDVALRAGAAGVHLPSRGLPPARVRQEMGQRLVVGVSVHDATELARAEEDGADYALLGPVFATRSHPGAPPLGARQADALARSAGLPVWGVGGIDQQTAPRLAGSSLQGVAVIRGLLLADDPAAVLALLKAVPTSRS